jgi:hypothetical protein
MSCSKLTSLLEKRDVVLSTIQSKLKILQGKAKSTEAVKKWIENADLIVTGVGISCKNDAASRTNYDSNGNDELVDTQVV